MPTTVHKELSGGTAHAQTIKVLQAYLGQTVRASVDDQMRAADIIKLQQYLVTQAKFSAGNVNKSIDDQQLSAKLLALQVAANLP